MNDRRGDENREMRRGRRRGRPPAAGEDGFTLIEVLVTVLILGLLAAVVFPVVANRAGDADPAVVANDLANLRTGMELFQLDVRPALPGDLEDLVNQIATDGSDQTPDAQSFTTGQQTRWNGPYVDLSVPDGLNPASSAKETAFNGSVINDLDLFDVETNTVTTTVSNADFVSIRITGLATAEFEDVNDQIDGDNEPDGTGASDSQSIGKLRFIGGDAMFLALPFKQ